MAGSNDTGGVNVTVVDAGVAGDELGRAAGVHDPATPHDRHPVAEGLGLVHEMGDQHDRGAPVADLTDRASTPRSGPGGPGPG